MFSQAGTRRWPSGDSRSLATLRIADKDLEKFVGQALESGTEDGVGRWRGAGGKLESGTLIELVRYLDSPSPEEYEVRVDAALEQDAYQAVLSELLSALNLGRDNVTWLNES